MPLTACAKKQKYCLRVISGGSNVLVTSGGAAASSLGCSQGEHGKVIMAGWLWTPRKDELVSSDASNPQMNTE